MAKIDHDVSRRGTWAFLWGGSDSQNYYGYLFLRRDATGSTICSCKVKFFRLRWASLSKYDEIIAQISPPCSQKFWERSFLWQKNFQAFCNAYYKAFALHCKTWNDFQICAHQCLYADIQNKQENCCMVFVWFNRQYKFI